MAFVVYLTRRSSIQEPVNKHSLKYYKLRWNNNMFI